MQLTFHLVAETKNFVRYSEDKPGISTLYIPKALCPAPYPQYLVADVCDSRLTKSELLPGEGSSSVLPTSAF